MLDNSNLEAHDFIVSFFATLSVMIPPRYLNFGTYLLCIFYIYDCHICDVMKVFLFFKLDLQSSFFCVLV